MKTLKIKLFLFVPMLLGALLLYSVEAGAGVWTGAACAFVPDDNDITLYDLTDCAFRQQDTNLSPVVARCNVTNPRQDGANPGWTTMEISFIDTSATAGNFVQVRLYRTSCTTGTTSTVATCSSDSFSALATVQCRTCTFNHVFDFFEYAYYIRVYVDRSSTANTEIFYSVRLQ